MSRLTELHEALIVVAPIDGVDINRVISFKPSATSQQRIDAQAIADAWDFTEKATRSLLDVLTDIQNLSAADRAKLLAAMAAEFLQRHPRFAEKLGILVSGDE